MLTQKAKIFKEFMHLKKNALSQSQKEASGDPGDVQQDGHDRKMTGDGFPGREAIEEEGIWDQDQARHPQHGVIRQSHHLRDGAGTQGQRQPAD